MIELYLASASATEELGACLAQAATSGGIIYLRGQLGAGKTTLVRGFLRALGYQGAVKSPTYTLIEPYYIADKTIIHLDLYRVAAAEELEFLGLRDWLDEHAVFLVEWPERAEGQLPAADVDIRIEYADQARLCQLKAASALGETILTQLECSLIALRVSK